MHGQFDPQRATGTEHAHALDVGRTRQPPPGVVGILVAAIGAVIIAHRVGQIRQQLPFALNVKIQARRRLSGLAIPGDHMMLNPRIEHVTGIDGRGPAAAGVRLDGLRLVQLSIDDDLNRAAGTTRDDKVLTVDRVRDWLQRWRHPCGRRDRFQVARLPDVATAWRQFQTDPTGTIALQPWRLAIDGEQRSQACPGRQRRGQSIEQRALIAAVEDDDCLFAFERHAPGQRPGPGRIAMQNLGRAARQHGMTAAQRDRGLEVLEPGRLGVEVVSAAGAIAGGKHRRAWLAETLLGAVVNGRNPRQRQHRQQGLTQRRLAAAGEKAVDVVVVDEARHQVRLGVDAHHCLDALGQISGRSATGVDIDQTAVERKIEHPGHARLAVLTAHIAVDLAHASLAAGRVEHEALAEDMELLAAGSPRHPVDAGISRIRRVQEILEKRRRHIEGGIDPEAIDPDLADPPAIALAQGLAHARVLGVQIVEPGHLEIGFLLGIGKITHIRRVVIDRRRALRRVQHIVEIEGWLGGCAVAVGVWMAAEIPGGIGRIPGPVVTEIVAGVIDDDVLQQIHAALVQGLAQLPIICQRAVMGIDGHEIAGPIAVVTGVLTGRVPPLVGHRRRDPQRGGAQIVNIFESLRQSAQIAAAVMAAAAGIVFAHTLIVVARIAVVKTIDHGEIDDLIAPVRRWHRRCEGDLRSRLILLRCSTGGQQSTQSHGQPSNRHWHLLQRQWVPPGRDPERVVRRRAIASRGQSCRS